MKASSLTAAAVVDADLDVICAQARAEFDTLSGSSVLVVGGGGFLGYTLVQSLLRWNSGNTGAAPIDVTVWDNWIRGVPAWLVALRGHPQLSIETVDITKPLPDAVPHYDWIVHAASIASPTFYRLHPIETMDANVTGLRTLLDYAVSESKSERPVRGFLYFSTSEIYGDPPASEIPTPESYRGHVSCTGPRACYDESKRFGETLCVAFAQTHGLPISVARPFNNYGPGLRIGDKRVIPDFASDILAGRNITMLSSGSPTRTFCYVTDAMVGYLKVLVRGRRGEAYNIGVEGPEISVAELAERMTAIASLQFGYRGNVVRATSEDPGYLIDNPNRRCPLITKARAELEFDPVIALDDGLLRSLIWYRDNQEATDA